jgi:glycosyltransferase involved in cell wall biosynthesis
MESYGMLEPRTLAETDLDLIRYLTSMAIHSPRAGVAVDTHGVTAYHTLQYYTMSRHRILLQTNPLHLKTGLSRNAKNLLGYLFKTGRYDIAHYATQATLTNDPKIALTPWRTFGCIPPDQDTINRINGDAVFGRDASYGAVNIEAVVNEWKPTIWIGSDDVWSFPLAHYADKPWYKRLNGVHHLTVDSLPVLDQAFEQAKRSKHFLTWAPFGAREMRRVGGDSMAHVKSIYGMMDTQDFAPIGEAEKLDLRKRFNIPADVLVFLFVGRNQLRKSFPRVIEAFAQFKAQHPGVRAALHFHTSFSEKGAGWDLPKLAAYHGLKPDELLCTYVCKHCGAWVIAPYQGEDLKCPACGTDRSLVTTNIVHGVPENQMKLIYGFCDASLSCHTSGGQELTISQSLLCEKPLAVTSYSCGEDVCIPETKGFITPLSWTPYDEPGTCFIKAATRVGDIANFMRKVAKSSKRDLQESAEKGREWAVKTFGIDAIGAQWERMFSEMPTNLEGIVEVAAGEGKAPVKNPAYEPPQISDNTAWLKDIYKGILLMDVADHDEGLRHWEQKLSQGVSRAQIIAYFRHVAEQENAKAGIGGTVVAGSPAAQTDFWSLIDRTTGRKRLLLVIKESLGDCLMITQLFPGLKLKYPDHDIYVMTDPKHNEVFVGNPYIFRLLPYFPAGENEMIMTGAGQTEAYFDVFLHPAILTQRHLGYLSSLP